MLKNLPINQLVQTQLMSDFADGVFVFEVEGRSHRRDVGQIDALWKAALAQGGSDLQPTLWSYLGIPLAVAKLIGEDADEATLAATVARCDPIEVQQACFAARTRIAAAFRVGLGLPSRDTDAPGISDTEVLAVFERWLEVYQHANRIQDAWLAQQGDPSRN